MIDRQRLDALLDVALDLAPAERAAFLAQECETAELRSALERLIAAAEQQTTIRAVGGALWQAVARELGGGTQVGDRLGAYRIVGELGRGGMAVVYLAERADGQYEQRVALKMLERSASDALAVARFERERQILASLEHPGIGRILDGGIAPDGRPWFAMEHVEGARIDTYCDENGLDVPARLRMFAEVAVAVAAAHRQLIVHRDIKPSNILVSKDGRPKLLDFGIAKLLEEDSAPDLTRAASPLTPRYASPEQASGQPVTTASDVYQLGLLLYEMLCGQRAFSFSGSTPSELRERAGTQEPTRPSGVVDAELGDRAARARGLTSARQLRRVLTGDLDTIVLAALRPQPQRRYESASRMAEDVQRYLAGQPISAQPDSLAYRAHKFVGRNRWAVAAATAALVTILGLSAFYTVQLRHERDAAEKEAQKASRVSQFLAELFEASDPFTARQVASRTAIELLDEGAKRIETEENSTLAAEPEVRASMLHTIGTVYRHLGQSTSAERLLAPAVAIRKATLGPDHPDTLLSQQEYAVALRALNRLDEALVAFREIHAARTRQLPADEVLIAAALTDLAHVLERLERRDEARPLALQAIDILEHAATPDWERLSHAHWVLGTVLANSGDASAGIEQTQAAIALLRDKVDADHWKLGSLNSELAFDLRSLGRVEDSARSYADAIRTSTQRLGPDHSNLAWIRANAAQTAIALAQYDEALAMAEESLPVLVAAWDGEHYAIGLALQVRAQALAGVGRLDEALESIVAAEEMYVRTLGEEAEDVVTARRERARILAQLGRGDEAIGLLAGLVETIPPRPEVEDHLASVLCLLGELELERGEAGAALSALGRGLEIGTRLAPAGSVEQVLALLSSARAHSLLGDDTAASAEVDRAAALAQQLQGITPAIQARLDSAEGQLRR